MSTQKPPTSSKETLNDYRTINYRIIIPCFNDEESLKKVLENLEEIAEIEKVIIVDDGSTPPVGINSKAQIIRSKKNQGLASAVKKGMQHALNENAECIVKIDADGQMDITKLPEFILSISEGIDIVCGQFDPSRTPKPIIKDDKIFTNLTNWLLNSNIPSVLAEYRAYSPIAAERYIKAPVYRWESPYGIFYCNEMRMKQIENSIRLIPDRPFPLNGMIALRVGLLKHTQNCKASYIKLFFSGIVLFAHLFFNLLFNNKHNGGNR